MGTLVYIGLLIILTAYLGQHAYKMRKLHRSAQKLGLHFSHSLLWTTFEITGSYKSLQLAALSQVPLFTASPNIFHDRVNIYINGQLVEYVQNLAKQTATDHDFLQTQLDHAIDKYHLQEYNSSNNAIEQDLPIRNRYVNSYNFVLYFFLVVIIIGLAIQL